MTFFYCLAKILLISINENIDKETKFELFYIMF